LHETVLFTGTAIAATFFSQWPQFFCKVDFWLATFFLWPNFGLQNFFSEFGQNSAAGV